MAKIILERLTDLSKSFSTAGKVRKPVTAYLNGKPYHTHKWVGTDEEAPAAPRGEPKNTVTAHAYGRDYQDCMYKSLTFSGWKLQGRRKVHGMDISIENRKGSTRRGTDADGHKWATKMQADYGYIRGTVGKDKDHVDAYVGPNPESTHVFIIHQNNPATGAYDEDKIMLGFDSSEEAKALYLKQYDRPGFFGSMEETDVDTFKEKAFAAGAKGNRLVIKKSVQHIFGVDPELVVGIKVEMEHTDDPEEARKIAMDHISETPDYYSRLIAAGLVDEPGAVKAAKRLGLAKSTRLVVPILSKGIRLANRVPVKKTVTRDGTTFTETYWVTPEQARAGDITGAQLDLFDAAPPIPARKPETDPKKIEEAIQSATPETRNEVQAVLYGKENPPEKPEKSAYVFSPGSRFVSIGEKVLKVPDYTGVVPKEITSISAAKIAETERPSWIPEVNPDYFQNEFFRLPFFRRGPNEYLLQVAPASAIVASADVVAATWSYYRNLAKAENAKKAEEADERARKRAEEFVEKHKNDDPETMGRYNRDYMEYAKDILAGKRKTRAKPVRSIGEMKMSFPHAALLRNMGIETKSDRFAHLREGLREIEQKATDLALQLEDSENTYSKGQKTSYGDSGTKDTLLEKYGVLVKRQNGDEISDSETEDIRKAMDSIYPVFGDRSSMARKFGLKISHAGGTAMHARKAIGIFFPHYHAIGVSASGGDKQFGFTLAHEWAHFMDHYLGGSSYHYASDEYGSLAHSIARTFRDNMAKPQTSKYQNRTCECFARAFEQYFSMKSGDGADYQAKNNSTGNHPKNEAFKERVAPLIDRFFEERGEMLKAMKVNVWMIQ